MGSALEKVLRSLQSAVRAAGSTPSDTVGAKRLQVLRTLVGDTAYADVDGLADLVDSFVQRCQGSRGDDHVPRFVQQLADLSASVRDVTVLFGLRHMKIGDPITIGEAEFLTIGEWPAVPAPGTKPYAVARVAGRGTDTGHIAQRCRLTVEEALRRLRVTASGAVAVPQMLRFGLDGNWATEDGKAHGWIRQDDEPVPLDLGKLAAALAQERPVLLEQPALPLSPAGRQASFAMLWLDQATLSTDLLVRSIFPVFALEALLGDRAEGLKARSLVFHRVLLGRAVSGWIPNPAFLHTFYDKVRSYAVHGSIPPHAPDDQDADFLLADAKAALGEYMALSKRNGFQTRRELKDYLLAHPSKEEVLQWLHEQDAKTWEGFDITPGHN